MTFLEIDLAAVALPEIKQDERLYNLMHITRFLVGCLNFFRLGSMNCVRALDV